MTDQIKTLCCPINRRGSDGSGISLDGGVPLKIDVNSGEGGVGLGEDDTEDDEREEEGEHDNGPNSGKNNMKKYNIRSREYLSCDG